MRQFSQISRVAQETVPSKTTRRQRRFAPNLHSTNSHQFT